jgi:hypothetical protein
LLNIKSYADNDQEFLKLAKKLEEYEAYNAPQANNNDNPDVRTLNAQHILSEERELNKILTNSIKVTVNRVILKNKG